MKRLIVLLIIAVLVGVATAITVRAAGDEPAPVLSPAISPIIPPMIPPIIPKAFKGEQCVEPVGAMRRFHGEYLLHQRDETMRRGIRGKKYSLRGCVECHAVPEKQGKDPPSARTVEPFCASCHTYAAVRIDCFECHTPKAPKAPKTEEARESRWMGPKEDTGQFAGLQEDTGQLAGLLRAFLRREEASP